VTSLDEELELENAADNPELLAAAQALVSESEAPRITDPLDGPVTLPTGFRRVKSGSDGTQFEDVRNAWVRELNGEDEERIARTKLKNDSSAFLTAILEAGVDRLGDSRPTKDDLHSLTLGDRDYLLLEIARVTYGDEFKFDQYVCNGCGEKIDVELSLREDIPVTRLDKVEDATFEVRLKNDRIATVTLPTCEIAHEIMDDATTGAEVNTILIAHAVEEIRGPKGVTKIAGDRDVAKRLGLTDRQALVIAMGERMPGPQYNKITFTHEPGCGEENHLVITLGDLFRDL
jgi:hypothetical protein